MRLCGCGGGAGRQVDVGAIGGWGQFRGAGSLDWLEGLVWDENCQNVFFTLKIRIRS